ncbi:cysteine methyltransferase [Wenjunlia vitaminophila]|uniref:Methylated-DNA--protein-cysteine methyltransferase n=1 Tax=Wenjunlia vitaminophila TaxID=76728 RepID=A0A0T6LVF4_WENVI|nr:methylated-DNA--[protein]-cysteine S-methyltransferase [Wenjunlia vitaminophila]KRV50009.1 cysteine methyltransferase [Wenjunlia vitaminophila]
MTVIHTTVPSPVGELLLVGEECAAAPGGTALAAVSVPGQKGGAVVQDDWVHAPDAFTEIAAQLAEYFAGRRTRFDFVPVPTGTEFQQRVWGAVDDIPYGSTRSYGEVTATIGAPRGATRAVGAAVGANPLSILRPCHRVVGADGALTGYAGGLARKRQLLLLEGATRIVAGAPPVPPEHSNAQVQAGFAGRSPSR